MEIKVLFYGTKRRKTVWKGRVEMLYKFGEGQLISFGLPEMPRVWLTHLMGTLMDPWGGGAAVGPEDAALLQDLTAM